MSSFILVIKTEIVSILHFVQLKLRLMHYFGDFQHHVILRNLIYANIYQPKLDDLTQCLFNHSQEGLQSHPVPVYSLLCKENLLIWIQHAESFCNTLHNPIKNAHFYLGMSKILSFSKQNDLSSMKFKVRLCMFEVDNFSHYTFSKGYS